MKHWMAQRLRHLARWLDPPKGTKAARPEIPEEIREDFLAMTAEMRDPDTTPCECGYPQKPCLRIVLRNGPPFPKRPCDPLPQVALSRDEQGERR